MAGRSPAISNAAVKKATGKTWVQWFRILDRFPKSKTHRDRAAWLYKRHLKRGWWCQMVTVTYEQARDLRKKHETTEGYQISGSRTLPVPVSRLYAWCTTKRSRWFKVKGLKVNGVTKNKYLHLDWPGGTKVDINFWPRGAKKSQVQVQQRQLKTAAEAKRMKRWWAKKLDKLAPLIS